MCKAVSSLEPRAQRVVFWIQEKRLVLQQASSKLIHGTKKFKVNTDWLTTISL